MDRNRGFQCFGRAGLVPLLLIGLGAFAFVGRTGALWSTRLWAFWPLLWICLGLGPLLSRTPARRGLGALLAGAGVLGVLNNLGLLPLKLLSALWPVGLIVLGLWMLYAGRIRQGRQV